jgi:hypothetical protein
MSSHRWGLLGAAMGGFCIVGPSPQRATHYMRGRRRRICCRKIYRPRTTFLMPRTVMSKVRTLIPNSRTGGTPGLER